MASLRVNQTKTSQIYVAVSLVWSRFSVTSGCLLGIDEDDEQEEEDEEGVSLLEVEVPQGLGNFRKAVAGKQTAQLWRKHKHRHIQWFRRGHISITCWAITCQLRL